MAIRRRRDEIRKRLEAEASPQAREREQLHAPGSFVIGVRIPKLRALAAEYKMPFEEAADYLDVVSPAQVREELLLGIFALARWPTQVAGLRWRQMASWIQAVDNRKVCDHMAESILAIVVSAHEELASELDRMAEAENAWMRRMALWTASVMQARDRRHAPFTERLCERLAKDRDSMIRESVRAIRRQLAKAKAG